jgi:hypothetical protein
MRPDIPIPSTINERRGAKAREVPRQILMARVGHQMLPAFSHPHKASER